MAFCVTRSLLHLADDLASEERNVAVEAAMAAVDAHPEQIQESLEVGPRAREAHVLAFALRAHHLLEHRTRMRAFGAPGLRRMVSRFPRIRLEKEFLLA